MSEKSPSEFSVSTSTLGHGAPAEDHADLNKIQQTLHSVFPTIQDAV